jgi:hypothetical protein
MVIVGRGAKLLACSGTALIDAYGSLFVNFVFAGLTKRKAACLTPSYEIRCVQREGIYGME